MTVSGGDLSTPAHAAAYHGDTSALMALAKQHPELLRARNEEGETPAHHAAAAGMATTLESLGALDINLLTAVDSEGWCVGLSAWNILASLLHCLISLPTFQRVFALNVPKPYLSYRYTTFR